MTDETRSLSGVRIDDRGWGRYLGIPLACPRNRERYRLTELVHRRPARWRPDVEACFALLQDYGPAALHDAFTWGVQHGAIGAEYVRTRLATLATEASA